MRIVLVLAVLAMGLGSAPIVAAQDPSPPVDGVLRVAAFNVALAREEPGALTAALQAGDDAQATAVASVLQAVRPDIVLINEFDFDADGAALSAFRSGYLAVSQNGGEPLDLPHAFLAPVNTGVPSGLDLDQNGTGDGPGDALGFGWFPGQYGMLVLSRYPIDTEASRTFRSLLWRDMPGARLPDHPERPGQADYYSPAVLDVLPLSSKSHWDVVVQAPGGPLHLLASHPTPPVFDGPEDRNGRRNADEVRFWNLYITEGAWPALRDDRGTAGTLASGAAFVLLGDLNLDSVDGDGDRQTMLDLLAHPRVRDTQPGSVGAVAAAEAGGASATHRGDPAMDTADFNEDGGPGNLRVDYVLPSADLTVVDSGVLWPAPGDPLAEIVEQASDHRLVWVDIRFP